MIGARQKIHQEQKQESNKCYSLHAPEVECIVFMQSPLTLRVWLQSRGRHDHCQQLDCGHHAHHGTPHNGPTLKPAVAQVQCLSGSWLPLLSTLLNRLLDYLFFKDD
jgi:transposase, IS5 family